MAEDAKKEEVKLSADQKKVLELVEKMSALDLSKLVKAIEDKFGVSAAAPVAMAVAPTAGDAAGGAAEEKSEYDVELTDAGSQKIAVIKAIKGVTGLGLKEAKELVDGAPKIVKEKMPKEEAEELKKQIEEAGGKAELK